MLKEIHTPDYLIFHPKRVRTETQGIVVYHDPFSIKNGVSEGNQDPYLWNDPFLHTFCHITEITKNIGQMNFWVWGSGYPNFTQLLCDCVFVIGQKLQWELRNEIAPNDPIVDNQQAYEHHYQWSAQHPFRRRKRFTLKADPGGSFQPQTADHLLIDILPFLQEQGVSSFQLIQKMTTLHSGKKSRNSRPYKLPEGVGEKVYEYLWKNAAIKLSGEDLADKHP